MKKFTEEEWDALATIVIADVPDVKEAVEPKEEEIDFESWFFEEPILEETEVVSYVLQQK